MAVTDWTHPTAFVGIDWSGATNATDDNTSVASPATVGHIDEWTTFKNAAETSSLLDLLPSDLTSIDGIEIRLRLYDVFGDSDCHCECSLSWDGRTTFTSGTKATDGRVPSAGNITNGSPGQNYLNASGSTATHGRSWSRTEFSDANFAIRIEAAGSYPDQRLEFIELRVHYTPAGGGGGIIPQARYHYDINLS